MSSFEQRYVAGREKSRQLEIETAVFEQRFKEKSEAFIKSYAHAAELISALNNTELRDQLPMRAETTLDPNRMMEIEYLRPIKETLTKSDEILERVGNAILDECGV